MGRKIATGGVVLVAAAAACTAAYGAGRCAKPMEVTAIQAAAIQQELMVAALTCNEVSRFNEFQTSYSRELRESDAALEHMFKRLYGGGRGEEQYHAFKTRLANNSSMKSINNNPDYCREAGQVFEAALASNKPTLADFVAGIPVTEPSPVDSCEIKVAVGLVGAKVAPNVVPKPNPLRLATATDMGFPDNGAKLPPPTLTPPPPPTGGPGGNN